MKKHQFIVWLVLSFGAYSLGACQSTKTIYIVRHAERQSNTDDTTPLSEAGHERARQLAELLANKGIDSIYSTNYQRTIQTAQPLAQKLNKTIAFYNPSPNSVIVSRLQKLGNNQTALVVGHSNTVLEIVKGLGGKPTLQTIPSTDFDNLFVVKIKSAKSGNEVSMEELHFGKPTD